MEKRTAEEFRNELFHLKVLIGSSHDLNQIQKLRQEMTRLKKQETALLVEKRLLEQEQEKELLKQEKGRSK